jgi:hypothetical protein
VTSRDTPIPWGRYSTDQVEDLIAALLLRRHRGAERMNGSGGDDGIDVLVPVGGGIHVFEIKSYRELLKPAQRRAIEKSARTAAEKNPDMVAWTLVMPLDHTPAERRWMDKDLAAIAGVPVDWIGRTRLEVELAQHPDLVRSYAPGSVEHLAFDLLAEHDRQAVPPRTIGEAVQRAQRLGDHANAIDPFYAFDISIQPAAVTVTARPKDQNAPPLHGSVSFRAEPGSREAGAIDDFMTYGLPLTVGAGNIADVQISLPESMKDLLPDDLAAERLSLGPAPNAAQARQSARLDAVDESGRVLGSLSVTFTEAFRGPRGGTYRAGLDRSGFLRLVMKVGTGTRGEFEVHSQYTGDLLPSDLLPPLRFLDAARRAAGLRITMDGQTASARIPDAAARMPSVENMIRIAEALERIQRAAGIAFPVPEHWSSADALNIAFYDELLHKGQAPYPSPGFTLPVPLEGVRRLLAQGPLPRVSAAGQQNQTARLLGAELPLPAPFTFETQQLLVANPLDLARQYKLATPPPVLEVELAADQRTVTMFRIDSSPPLPRP